MTNKEKKNKQKKFQTLAGQDNVSAGVCGPDGCLLAWNKTAKKGQADQQQ